MILGVAGIGKTTLGAKLIEEYKSLKNIYWYQLHEWNTLSGILEPFSDFLKEINKRTAWTAERFLISHIKTNYNANLNKWASLSMDRPKLDKKELFEIFKRAKPPEL